MAMANSPWQSNLGTRFFIVFFFSIQVYTTQNPPEKSFESGSHQIGDCGIGWSMYNVWNMNMYGICMAWNS